MKSAIPASAPGRDPTSGPTLTFRPPGASPSTTTSNSSIRTTQSSSSRRRADPGRRRQSPDERLTLAAVRPYAAACDVHGIDIYPIPPGAHAGGPPVNTDISVVGDMTSLIARASTQKAIWTTLQV